MTLAGTAPRKRRHVERPDIRAKLLDAAEALIREEGYAAATARKIAGRVGLKHQVIFYYFGSQDALLIEVFQRAARTHRDRLQAALHSGHPISAMWRVSRDPDATRFTLEIMALANHNEAIRGEIAREGEALRRIEAEAVETYLKQRGIEPRMSPQMVSILTNALARLLVQESALGIRLGHEEAEALIEASLHGFESAGITTDAMETIIAPMSRPDSHGSSE